jgi:type 1 glutamine amidotransferase
VNLPFSFLRRFRLGILATALAAALGVAAQPADARKTLVMLIAEPEYETAKTLPVFAAACLKDFHVVIVTGSKERGSTAFENLSAIARADVLFVSVHRRSPPRAQLEAIRRYVASGKPVVGIRTACHAFLLKDQKVAAGNAEWPEWDAEVIGGSYTGHHGKGPTSQIVAAAPDHAILRGVKVPFQSGAWLYKVSPLRVGAQPLLIGTIPGRPSEPVAWTFTRQDGGRTFYTSLGLPSDFQNPAFTQLLRNGILWASGASNP